MIRIFILSVGLCFSLSVLAQNQVESKQLVINQ